MGSICVGLGEGTQGTAQATAIKAACLATGASYRECDSALTDLSCCSGDIVAPPIPLGTKAN